MAKKKKTTPQKRHFEKVNFEDYDEYAAMIDRMLFHLTGKTSKRTPEEEAEMRADFETLKAENAADDLKKKDQ